MSIENKHDLDGLREAGRIVRTALDEMERHIHPGVSTLELNEIGADVLAKEPGTIRSHAYLWLSR